MLSQYQVFLGQLLCRMTVGNFLANKGTIFFNFTIVLFSEYNRLGNKKIFFWTIVRSSNGCKKIWKFQKKSQKLNDNCRKIKNKRKKKVEREKSQKLNENVWQIKDKNKMWEFFLIICFKLLFFYFQKNLISTRTKHHCWTYQIYRLGFIILIVKWTIKVTCMEWLQKIRLILKLVYFLDWKLFILEKWM